MLPQSEQEYTKKPISCDGVSYSAIQYTVAKIAELWATTPGLCARPPYVEPAGVRWDQLCERKEGSYLWHR